MYFFDAQDFAFPKGSATGSMQIFWRDTWYSHYYMKDFVFVNNPDGTLGVYYDENQFTGSTTGIQNFTSQITEEFCNVLSAKFDETRNEIKTAFYDGYNQLPECYRLGIPYTCASERFATFFQSFGLYKNVPNCYWDRRRNACATKPHPMGVENEDGSFSDLCCGDNLTIDFDKLTTEPLSGASTNEKFDLMMNTELVDAKNRKTLSSYPTLRALYDRYFQNKTTPYNYESMDNVSKLIDNNWIDVIEQLVPATTIWGSVKVYSNTVFDQQKFTYKKGSLFTCVDTLCNLDGIEEINNCLTSIIDNFYSDECPPDDLILPYFTEARMSDFFDDDRTIPSGRDIAFVFFSAEPQCNYSSYSSMVSNTVSGYDMEDIRGEYRYRRNDLWAKETYIMENMSLGFRKSQLSDLNIQKTNLEEYTLDKSYTKGQMKRVKYTWWREASTYSAWTATTYVTHSDTLNNILTGVTDVNYLTAIFDISELPLTGSSGDLIVVGTPTDYLGFNNNPYTVIATPTTTPENYVGYAWDPILNDWSTDLYDFIDTEILIQRRAQRLNSIEKKRDMLMAIRPFLWANEHMYSPVTRNYGLSNVVGTIPFETFYDIVNNNGANIPPFYINTASTVTLPTFNDNNKIIK